MKHILLQKALRYKQRKQVEEPNGFTFDNKIGAWISKVNNSLLIQSLNFQKLGTKKEDIETGEDQKGQ